MLKGPSTGNAASDAPEIISLRRNGMKTTTILRQSLLVLSLALLFFSCSKDNSLVVPVPEVVIKGPTDEIELFPGSYTSIDFPLESGSAGEREPVVRDSSYGSFEIVGPWFTDETKKTLYSTFWGRSISNGPRTITYAIELGDETHRFPLTVRVSDFYYANSFRTNLPGDTLRIPRGGSFLLHITCLDTMDRAVPRSFIGRIALGYSVVWGNGIPDEKWEFKSVSWDTVSYSFVFEALQAIIPGPDDKNMYWQFQVSNKQLYLPVRITY
jgi:hypothetical protein